MFSKLWRWIKSLFGSEPAAPPAPHSPQPSVAPPPTAPPVTAAPPADPPAKPAPSPIRRHPLKITPTPHAYSFMMGVYRLFAPVLYQEITDHYGSEAKILRISSLPEARRNAAYDAIKMAILETELPKFEQWLADFRKLHPKAGSIDVPRIYAYESLMGQYLAMNQSASFDEAVYIFEMAYKASTK